MVGENGKGSRIAGDVLALVTDDPWTGSVAERRPWEEVDLAAVGEGEEPRPRRWI